MAERQTPKATATTGACPVCKSLTVETYRPFCSKRCADIDLGRWLKGAYVVAGNAREDDEDGGEAGIDSLDSETPKS